MRTQTLLFLSSIALSSPAPAAEPKAATGTPNGKPGVEANSKAREAASSAANDETIQSRPTGKNRIRFTYPPSAKRM